jgi:glycosyltransferase involved in cell wall biosynthesis
MYELQTKEVVYLDDYNYSKKNQYVITFDGVYKNVLEYAAPILHKFKYPFELFVTGDYIGKNNRWDINEPYAKFADIDELKKMVKMGARLQWHTKSHPAKNGFESIEQIRSELSVPQYLRKIDPKGFKWLAYPHGNYTSELLSEARKKFVGALSADQGDSNDKYLCKRYTVTNNSKFKSTTVAVIIASYNYGNFLVEAIESVLRQTIAPDEILITDDCSSDNTQEIAIQYQKMYPNLIKYNRNRNNLGIVKNFNKSVSLTSSDYILFLGADNRLVSNYIEETKRILDSAKKIGIAYTDFALFGPRAKIKYNSYPDNFKGKIIGNYLLIDFPIWDRHSKKRLQKQNFIHGSSVYKRTAFETVGGYLETNKAEDHDLFKRIVNNGWKAKKACRTILEYRQHSKEQQNIKSGTQSELNFYKENYRKLLDEKQRLSRKLVYKILIPLMLYEKMVYVFNQKGFKELIKRSGAFFKRIFF